jgi:hypothetical protein
MHAVHEPHHRGLVGQAFGPVGRIGRGLPMTVELVVLDQAEGAGRQPASLVIRDEELAARRHGHAVGDAETSGHLGEAALAVRIPGHEGAAITGSGRRVRSAAHLDGTAVGTVELSAGVDGRMHPLVPLFADRPLESRIGGGPADDLGPIAGKGAGGFEIVD